MEVRLTPGALLLRLLVLLGACAAIRAAAADASWFELVAPGVSTAARVEVDTATLVDRGFGPEMQLRVTPTQPRVHSRGFDFASFVAVVRFDCGADALVPLSVSYHDAPRGQGAVAGTETDLSAAGIDPALLAGVDPAVSKALLRGACLSAAYGAGDPSRPASDADR